MAIPAVACERCGAVEPTEVLSVFTYEGDPLHSKNLKMCSICKKCRKSLMRWIRRGGDRS